MEYNTRESSANNFFKCKKCRFHLFAKESIVKHCKESDRRECDFGVFLDQNVGWLNDAVKEVEGKV
jgi:hypothetical protein